jgi:hypothetical protein
VLTEAIEAERGAEAVTASAVGLVVSAMAMTTALLATITAEVDGLALALAPPMMTAITAPRVALIEKTGKMSDAPAVNASAAQAGRNPQSSMRMNVTGGQFSFSSLRHV